VHKCWMKVNDAEVTVNDAEVTVNNVEVTVNDEGVMENGCELAVNKWGSDKKRM